MYAELFCKTNYSFLEGASRPAELVERAAQLKLKALAITDRDGVYGIPKAYHESKSHPALKLIVGTELTFENHPRIRLLARDRTAYGLMCRMITASHMGTPGPGFLPANPNEYVAYKEKGQASLHWQTFLALIQAYPEAARGLLALPIDFTCGLEQVDPDFPALREIFGDRLYLPLCRVLDGRDRLRTERARELSQRYGMKIVAVNDVHYHSPVRRPLHDVISSVREGTKLSEAGSRLFSNAERYLKSGQQMSQLFRDLPDALAQTLSISESCVFSPGELRYYYPSEWIPQGETAQSFLQKLVEKGAQWRYPEGVPENVTAQLRHEMTLIEALRYADYFLTIWDVVEFARGKGILCQGRGSAANSAVCYVLGITAIDPVKMNLLFERFLSMERNEPPDIDVDFENGRREEVIQYIYEKYGRHRAGMVAAVITYRSRLSTREVSKVLDVPLEEVAALAEEESETTALDEGKIPINGPDEFPNAASHARMKAAKLAEIRMRESANTGRLGAGKIAEKSLKAAASKAVSSGPRPKFRGHPRDVGVKAALTSTSPDLFASSRPAHDPAHEKKVRMARTLADELYGFPRHLSIHSGGFTLSRDPLIETVPVEPARMEGRTIVQWDKDDLEAIGLLKVDILALGMLTAMKKTFDLLGNRYTLANIPPDDFQTWRMIQRGDTVGVFQIESRAQMGMLPRLKPSKFYDLVVQVAIVRPGPIVGKMVHPYLKRRRGLEPVEYPHPALESILGRTYGVPIFQEQVMKMSIALAGFSPGEADELRRAIAAWKTEGSMEKVGAKLKAGLLQSGLKTEYVEQIFEQIRGFSEYGFPESHAASFAHLAWASSFLKAHHPAEFTCALLNSQPMGFYSTHTLVDDAKRHRVKILPIDPQISIWDCTMEAVAQPQPGHPAIRLGWSMVRGMSEKEAEKLVREREAGGPFKSLQDFVLRTRLRQNILHQLAIGDAFLGFGLDRRHALWEILALAQAEGTPADPERARPGEQLALALVGKSEPGKSEKRDDAAESLAGTAPAPSSLFPAMNEYEAIRADYRAYGASVQGHPMQGLRKLKSGLPPLTIAQARRSAHGKNVSVPGLMIVRQRPPTAKGTCFGTLEDETGLLDLIFHKNVFEEFETLYWNVPFLIVEGKLQRDGDAISVIVKRLKPIFDDVQSEQTARNFVKGVMAPASRVAPLVMMAKIPEP